MDRLRFRVCPTVLMAVLAGGLLACANAGPRTEGAAAERSAQDLSPVLAADSPDLDQDAESRKAGEPTADGLVGVIVPREAIDLVPRVQGTIAVISVALGERVQAGQLLGRMDDSAIRAQLAVARSDLKEAQADRGRASAERRHARRRMRQQRKLARAGVVSAASVSDARLQAERSASVAGASSARVGTARARIEALEQSRAQCAILAPFDGRVAARLRDAGAVIGAGEAVLRIISEDRWIRFAAPAALREQLIVGRRVQVSTGDGARLTARVLNVAPDLDAASGLVFAEATIVTSVDAEGLPGAGTPARVILGAEDIVVLPLAAEQI